MTNLHECRNCVYHMSGNPPVCNALHTPQSGEIECVDWEAKEKTRTSPFIDLIALERARQRGFQEFQEMRSRLSRKDLYYEVEWREEEGQMANSTPQITLSQLQEAFRTCYPPRRLGERCHFAVMDHSRQDFYRMSSIIPFSIEPPNIRHMELVAISTSLGLKWQFQGDVISD